MDKLLSTFLTLFVFIATGISANAKGPFGSIKVGQWSGGAYTNDQTGAFSGCTAGAPYQNGVYVVISKHIDNSWSLGFASEKFHLTAGDTFPIDLTFDAGAPVHLFGTVIGDQTVGAILPNNSILNLLGKSHLMVAVAKGATFQFSLTSAGKVIATIENCFAKTKAGGIASAGDFSIQVSTTAVKATPAATPPSPATAKTFEQDGTGFIISSSGHIVTNYHVISGCVGDVHGNLTGEPQSPLRIVATDETNDLALLQASKASSNWATIRSTAIHPGDSIIAIGYPFHGLLTSDFTVTSGIVSSLSGLLNDTRYLQISAGVQSGNSGGPLLDTSGNVVGVVAAKMNALTVAKATGDLPQNINFAIKTGAVRDFLDNSAVSYETSESKSDLKTADIAAKARGYTVLIACTAQDKKD